MNTKLTISYEDEALLVVVKPRGIATAPLAKYSTTNNLTEYVFAYCPAIAKVQGFTAYEGGLLHRLDNDTEGLVLYAKTQEAFNFLQTQAKEGYFIKHYLAHSLTGVPTLPPDGFSKDNWQEYLKSNQFIHDKISLTTGFVKAQAKSSKVRAVGLSASAKATLPYTTNFTLSSCQSFIKVECTLTRGFRHQVRASLAALGLPIIHDPLYSAGTDNGPIQFWATALSFKHPNGRQLEVSYKPFMTH